MLAIDILKVSGIFLVTHSHMEHFYPLSQIATGGMLGNSLFFLVSSLGITYGLERKPEGFADWYYRRVRRVYIPLWLAVVFGIVAGFFSIDSLSELVRLFIYPAEYWFLPAISVLYILCYWQIVLRSRTVDLAVLGGSLTLYVLSYVLLIDKQGWSIENHILFKSLYYYMVMQLGILIARGSVRFPESSIWDVAAFIVLSGGFVGFLLFLQFSGAFEMQFVAHLIAAAWILSFLRSVQYAPIDRILQRHRRAIAQMSKLSLSVYLVQVPLVEISGLDQLPFPINVVVFWVVLLIMSYLFFKLSEFVTALYENATRAVFEKKYSR